MDKRTDSKENGLWESDDGIRFTGELSPDGYPDGRGVAEFPDGTRFVGSINWFEQKGSGVWKYNDGSTMTGGFTVSSDYPLLFFYPSKGESMPDTAGGDSADGAPCEDAAAGDNKTEPLGKKHVRYLRYFGTEPGDPGSPCTGASCRASFNPEKEDEKARADAVCAGLTRRFRAAGRELEYNARALLADMILSGELDENDVVIGAGFPRLFRVNDVFRLFFR
ncbi:MAG: hypothetical protein MJ137_09830 [Clostridia bacterium]|nr:hypothetical protein [Clostridia bacterium]